MKKQRAVYQLKLLQLNTYAKLECKGYQGPYLSLLYFPEAFKVKTSKLHKSVVKTLEAVVGGPKFCMTNVRLLAGYQLGMYKCMFLWISIKCVLWYLSVFICFVLVVKTTTSISFSVHAFLFHNVCHNNKGHLYFPYVTCSCMYMYNKC